MCLMHFRGQSIEHKPMKKGRAYEKGGGGTKMNAISIKYIALL